MLALAFLIFLFAAIKGLILGFQKINEPAREVPSYDIYIIDERFNYPTINGWHKTGEFGLTSYNHEL